MPADSSVRLRSVALAIGLSIAVVAFDQLTKRLIADNLVRGESWPSSDWPVRLIHVTNSGAAFGILQDTGPLLVIASVLGVSVIAVYLLLPGLGDVFLRLGLSLMLGGAVGNLVDRFREGEVVDFVKFPNFPAFNVADSAITIGVLLLVWGLLREPETRRERPPTREPSSLTDTDG